MELNESIFIAISFLLIGKMYFSIRNIFLSLRFISFDSIKNKSIRQKRLFIIIPLLREKGRIHECYERFKTWLRYSDNAYLIFITTEREVMEHGLSYERNTIYLLDLLMNSEKDFRDRIKKIHFPTFNKTLGEQLNYGIIAAENYYNFNKHDYVILYNADSKPDKMTLRHIINCMADNVLVAQQSALFLKNFGILARNSKIIPMVDSIYQSRWTLQHEIPRYIRSMSNAKLLNIRGLSSFAHCVGHGLLMRADILNSVGYFPSPRIGLEDSGLGFVLKSKKISIAPFPMLESAEVPSNIISLAVQKSRWFFGPISAPYYMDAALKAGGSRFICYILIVASWYHSIKWMLAGPVVCYYFWIATLSGNLLQAIILYMIYCYVPIAIAWKRFYVEMIKTKSAKFYKNTLLSLFIYPISHLLSSVFALIGFFNWCRILLLRQTFIQVKTDS